MLNFTYFFQYITHHGVITQDFPHSNAKSITA